MGSASSTRKLHAEEEKVPLSDIQIKEIIEKKYPSIKQQLNFYDNMIHLAKKEDGTNQLPEVYDTEVLEFFKHIFPDGDHDKILEFFAHGLVNGYNDKVLFLCGPVSGKTTVIQLVRKAIVKEVGKKKCHPADDFSFSGNYDENKEYLSHFHGNTFYTCWSGNKLTEEDLKIVENFTKPYHERFFSNITVTTHNYGTFVVEASSPECIPEDHPNIWKYTMKNRFKEFKNFDDVVKPGWIDATIRLLKKYNEK